MGSHNLASMLENAEGPFTFRPSNRTGVPCQGLIHGAGADTEAAATVDTVTSSVADKSFHNWRLNSTAATGTTRGVYMRMHLSSGAGGETARFYTVVKSNTPADTCNGAHISLGFGTTVGNITGLGTAGRFTIMVPDRSLGGTTAGVMSELWANGTSSTCGGTNSFFRACADGDGTGKAKIEDTAYLFDVNLGTNASGNMIGALGNEPTWATNKTLLIRCLLNNTVAYLVAVVP